MAIGLAATDFVLANTTSATSAIVLRFGQGAISRQCMLISPVATGSNHISKVMMTCSQSEAEALGHYGL